MVNDFKSVTLAAGLAAALSMYSGQALAVGNSDNPKDPLRIEIPLDQPECVFQRVPACPPTVVVPVPAPQPKDCHWSTEDTAVNLNTGVREKLREKSNEVGSMYDRLVDNYAGYITFTDQYGKEIPGLVGLDIRSPVTERKFHQEFRDCNPETFGYEIERPTVTRGPTPLTPGTILPPLEERVVPGPVSGGYIIDVDADLLPDRLSPSGNSVRVDFGDGTTKTYSLESVRGHMIEALDMGSEKEYGLEAMLASARVVAAGNKNMDGNVSAETMVLMPEYALNTAKFMVDTNTQASGTGVGGTKIENAFALSIMADQIAYHHVRGTVIAGNFFSENGYQTQIKANPVALSEFESSLARDRGALAIVLDIIGGSTTFNWLYGSDAKPGTTYNPALIGEVTSTVASNTGLINSRIGNPSLGNEVERAVERSIDTYQGNILANSASLRRLN